MTAAQLTGPVTGGRHGWPMSASLVNFGARGYIEEEFFLEGEAPVFRARDEQIRFDGRWDAVAAGTLPYKTRIAVRRPLDPDRFNGTVLLVWSNVSMGCDMVAHDTDEITEEGFAVVIVSAQAVGVHGFDGPHSLGLTTWDPERYGTLHIPSDDASYGIFTAAARAVGPARHTRGGVDPLPGLAVERIVATGASQSAARLHTYWNVVQPVEQVFDAFLLEVHFGWSTPLTSGSGGRPADLAAVVGAFHAPTLLRDDAEIPMLVVNTETEALTYFPVRRPDTDRFRFWEAAGASHAPLPGMHDVLAKVERDWGIPMEPPSWTVGGPNTMDTRPLRDAGMHRMHHWLTTGVAPASLPPIEIAGEPPRIRRDELSIARGGIRMPQVAVPLAVLRGAGEGDNPLAELSGSCEPLPAATLRRLYASPADYVGQVEAAIGAAITSGFLLERDAVRIRHEAELAAAGWSGDPHPVGSGPA
jgi:hypothetical protein